MLRKLGCFVMTLGLVLPVWAKEGPGTISGHVRDASGVPQMGAMVEIIGSAVVPSLRVFTDAEGFYSAHGLLPGLYSLKVSAPYFLPVLRSRVSLPGGSDVIVNVTLATLFDAVQSAPWKGPSDEDDWKWVLRSASNRPILRVVQAQAKASSAATGDRNLKGSLSFLAGSPSLGFGSTSDVSTTFAVEKSILATGTLAVRGNVGYGEGLPAAVVRASYRHKMPNGSEPQVGLTVRNLPAPDIGQRRASLQALALSTSDNFTLGDVLELKFGSELQTIQFMGRVNAFRPFGSADLHLSPNTVVEYSYTSSEPDSRLEKGFASAPADLTEAQPRVSVAGFSPALERAHHQEVSLSQRVGKNSLQAAFYADRVADPALTGVGEFSDAQGDVIPDPYSGTFTYRGNNLNTRGVRLVWQRKIASNMTATVDYAFGGVLSLDRPDAGLQDAQQWTEIQNRHTVAAKISGDVHCTKTRWIASYRWTSGPALTPVDMFDASPGQADPYFGLFLRQPIPGTGFFPGHVDAVIDIRNLLAQGYVPVMGNDGHTVYLVQAARAVRGGVAFTF
jgi:Carboxypeptidase regulatory-like domain